jgi:hypothetical protein
MAVGKLELKESGGNDRSYTGGKNVVVA